MFSCRSLCTEPKPEAREVNAAAVLVKEIKVATILSLVPPALNKAPQLQLVLVYGRLLKPATKPIQSPTMHRHIKGNDMNENSPCGF